MTTKTEVLPKEDTEVTEPDGFAHYVRITYLMKGGAVVALCGKRFVPETIAKAAERQICAKCADLMELVKAMED